MESKRSHIEVEDIELFRIIDETSKVYYNPFSESEISDTKNPSIGNRYEYLEDIDRGAFGEVIRAYDHKEKREVAIKIITDDCKIKNQLYLEAEILLKLLGHKYIIKLYDHFIFEKNFFLVFEVANRTLLSVLEDDHPNGCDSYLLRKLAWRLLRALEFLHGHRIIHCDLKPENIMVQSKEMDGLKLIDFGSSCYEGNTTFNYIQSRHYRAPEVMLGIPYSLPIDMWSFGLILAEALIGYQLFAGDDEYEQMALIMEVLGAPPRTMRIAKEFFQHDGTPKYICYNETKVNVGPPESRSLIEALNGCDDALFLDFLGNCIQWDPDKRATPMMAMKHRWLRRLRDEGPYNRWFKRWETKVGEYE